MPSRPPRWPSRLAPPALAAEDILWSVQGEHLDEASFCVEVREAALDAPHYVLEEIEAGPSVDYSTISRPCVAAVGSYASAFSCRR